MNRNLLSFAKSLMVLLFILGGSSGVLHSETPEKMDSQSLEEFKKHLKQFFIAHDYEAVLNELPDRFFTEKLQRDVDINFYSVVKACCLLRLDKKAEACDFMKKITLQYPHIESLFYFKSAADCANDNYGDATAAISRAIELSSSKKRSFYYYQQRAGIYAVRRMTHEVENDLQNMQQVRQEFLQGQIPEEMPGEYILRCFLESPWDRTVYMPVSAMSATDPDNPSISMSWRCRNLPEESVKELKSKFGYMASPEVEAELSVSLAPENNSISNQKN